jgi:regulatory protein
MTASCPLPSTSEPSREEQARALCLRLLTARARTRAELAGQLAKRGYPDDVSTHVLDRLAGVGLVDDADFAEQWVHSRLANAGKGKRALAAELRTKGVDNDVITSVLGGINPAAERGRAEELVRKKLRRENLSDEAADARVTRRLVGMLARRLRRRQRRVGRRAGAQARLAQTNAAATTLAVMSSASGRRTYGHQGGIGQKLRPGGASGGGAGGSSPSKTF